MATTKFKIGDRVRIPDRHQCCVHHGCTGTVIREHYDNGCTDPYIEWDKEAWRTHCNPCYLELIIPIGKQLQFGFMSE